MAVLQQQKPEVSLEEWERRKEFVSFTEEDAALLRELRPIAESYADEVIDGLYKKFIQFPETKAFFPDEKTLNRVKALQKDYFLGLTRGEYGADYLTNRLFIGRVHQMIKLSPRWYMGAYSIYKQLVFPKVIEASKHDLEKCKRILMALIRLISLDQEIAVTTYIMASELVITRQSEEIVELSTPVMQIWDQVLALPIIGTLDSNRAQTVMDSLLNRIAETGARIAIIDITGVPIVDTGVAQYLIKAVTASRLMGAECIISGIKPHIAEAIVQLGLTLEGIATKPTMADALALAFQHTGLTVSKTKT